MNSGQAGFSADELLSCLAARRGHFLLESGHHGELWLDVELLCVDPGRLRPLCSELAGRLRQFEAKVICGPLIEGAFIGLMVAMELGVAFCYSERYARPSPDGLFRAGYRLPGSLRRTVEGERVAIVNDVINAGSAVRGTLEELDSCHARVVAIGTLLTLGSAAQDFANTRNVALESLATLANRLWAPSECPLCMAGVPLEDVGGFDNSLGEL